MKKLTILLASLAAVAFLASAPATNAAEFIAPTDGQGNVSLSASETHRNLYVAGGSVSIASATQGDLFVGGGNVIVEGNVEQDLFVGGGNVTVNGTVGGDIRTAGGNVLINNTIGGDVMVAGGSVRISEKAAIGGDLVSGTGELILDGSVAGNVKAGGGSITLNSKIDGDVEVYADQQFIVGSKAVIAKEIKYQGVQEATVQDGAQIGTINFEKVERKNGGAGQAIAAIFTVTFLIKIAAFIIAGLILLKLFGRTSRRVVDHVQQNPWSNLGIGALFLVVVPILGIIALITFVGFYVAILAFLIYGLMLLLGTLVGLTFAGSLIIKLINSENGWRVNWQALVVGVIAVAIISLIPVIGMLICLGLMLMGVGALIRMLYGHIIHEQAINTETSTTIP